MDELVKVGVPVIAALVGIVIGAFLGRTTEHRQWLRNQKIDAYTNILRQIHVSIRALDAYHHGSKTAKRDDLNDITDRTNSRLILVASMSVRGALNFLDSERQRSYAAARSATYMGERSALNLAVVRVEEAMREDLNAADRDSLWQRVRFRLYKWFVYPPQDKLQRWRQRRRSS